ncbi:CrpP-related protein [Rhizobium straminoryzae]|uniref:Uncharacterized protein n=1 Tax=Rhizobium straminoryzae TaxID=1387186 RepID=A0A549TGI3_9HYPH|nr:CrpP-related protein [Rhizobium straminoryzae]TRL41894.1 hypothetical protein FNA46_03215 [Rhizobium straminoryzae]
MLSEMDLVLDWQQRGMSARVLGLRPGDNPLLDKRPARHGAPLAEWQAKCEAWAFGWRIEDASRN